LVLSSAYSLKLGWRRRELLPFAALPLLFGLQQVVEGFVWLDLLSATPERARTPALGFMFFSHFLWLFWVPLAAAIAERVACRRRLFFAMTGVGLVFGGAMYWPFVFDYDLWHVKIHEHSIGYYVDLVFDDAIPRDLSHGLYAVLTLVPLFASSSHRIKLLGAMMAIAAALTLLFFVYTFSSVWCFFAAGLSFYVLTLLRAPQELQLPLPLEATEAG
jgi:hypothetical protein